VRFGLRLSDPPTLSTIAALGGSVEEAVIEDGDYGLTVHLPRGEDLRRLIDAVREEYPDATVLAHRQASRRTSPSERAKESWVDELTDRQRRVLETAYFAGYYEWPRNSSGDEVAETLDISPPTFHEHLRAAENKLLGALVE
jgi:predicted DNA binding protein